MPSKIVGAEVSPRSHHDRERNCKHSKILPMALSCICCDSSSNLRASFSNSIGRSGLPLPTSPFVSFLPGSSRRPAHGCASGPTAYELVARDALRVVTVGEPVKLVGIAFFFRGGFFLSFGLPFPLKVFKRASVR